MLLADGIKTVTMKHIDVLSLGQRMYDRRAGAGVDGVTSIQEPDGVIEHHAIHTAGYIGTIFWIGEDVKVQW